MEEVEKIVRLLENIESLLRRQIKSKRLASLATSLSSVNLNASYRRETIDHLSEGLLPLSEELYYLLSRRMWPHFTIYCVIQASYAMSCLSMECVVKLLKKEIKSHFWNLPAVLLIFHGKKRHTNSGQSVLISWNK